MNMRKVSVVEKTSVPRQRLYQDLSKLTIKDSVLEHKTINSLRQLESLGV